MAEMVGAKLGFETVNCSAKWCCFYNRATDQDVQWFGFGGDIFDCERDAGERTEVQLYQSDASGLEDLVKGGFGSWEAAGCEVESCTGGRQGTGGFDADSSGAASNNGES